MRLTSQWFDHMKADSWINSFYSIEIGITSAKLLYMRAEMLGGKQQQQKKNIYQVYVIKKEAVHAA